MEVGSFMPGQGEFNTPGWDRGACKLQSVMERAQQHQAGTERARRFRAGISVRKVVLGPKSAEHIFSSVAEQKFRQYLRIFPISAHFAGDKHFCT